MNTAGAIGAIRAVAAVRVADAAGEPADPAWDRTVSLKACREGKAVHDTRTQLIERVGKPKSTVYSHVQEALAREVLAERKEGRTRWLRRIRPLPRAGVVLPDVEEVEGYFFGVPAPRRGPALRDFIHAIRGVQNHSHNDDRESPHHALNLILPSA